VLRGGSACLFGGEESGVGAAGAYLDLDFCGAFGAEADVCGFGAVDVDPGVDVAAFEGDADVGPGTWGFRVIIQLFGLPCVGLAAFVPLFGLPRVLWPAFVGLFLWYRVGLSVWRATGDWRGRGGAGWQRCFGTDPIQTR